MGALKIKDWASDFHYDIAEIAEFFRASPREYRSYNWWKPTEREPWREDVYKNEKGVMMQRVPGHEDHPVYLLPFEIEIAVWRYLYERCRDAADDYSDA